MNPLHLSVMRNGDLPRSIPGRPLPLPPGPYLDVPLLSVHSLVPPRSIPDSHPLGSYLPPPPLPSVHTWVPKERYVPRWDQETLQTESLAGSSHSLLTCRGEEGGREG